jgi:hypothetical protein
VNPEDASEAYSTPANLERHLVMEWIPREHLVTGIRVFDLQGTVSEYKSDWTLVSHAFDVQEDGPALLTCIFERENPQRRSSLFE